MPRRGSGGAQQLRRFWALCLLHAVPQPTAAAAAAAGEGAAGRQACQVGCERGQPQGDLEGHAPACDEGLEAELADHTVLLQLAHELEAVRPLPQPPGDAAQPCSRGCGGGRSGNAAPPPGPIHGAVIAAAPWEDSSKEGRGSPATPSLLAQVHPRRQRHRRHEPDIYDPLNPSIDSAQRLVLLGVSTGLGSAAVVIIIICVLVLLSLFLFFNFPSDQRDDPKTTGRQRQSPPSRPSPPVDRGDSAASSLLQSPMPEREATLPSVPLPSELPAEPTGVSETTGSEVVEAEPPPPLCPALTLPKTQVRFLVAQDEILKAKDVAASTLDVRSPNGKKLLQVSVEIGRGGSKSLAISSVGCDDDPRAVFANSPTNKSHVRILGKGGALYGEMSRTSWKGTVYYQGEPVLIVEDVNSANMVMKASWDGRVFATSSKTQEDGQHAWKLQAAPGVDAVLVLGCMLAILLQF